MKVLREFIFDVVLVPGLLQITFKRQGFRFSKELPNKNKPPGAASTRRFSKTIIMPFEPSIKVSRIPKIPLLGSKRFNDINKMTHNRNGNRC